MAAEQTFEALDLRDELLSNLVALGYTDMTMVQAQALPWIVAGNDVLARAKTGSGKTAAFGLGLLNKLDSAETRVQGLVLCPTRELAEQVGGEIRRLARAIGNVKILTLCGGMAIRPQTASLRHGAHIVVGTPGRVLNHLRKKSLDLGRLTTLVLDEADRMLDMGFEDELNAILEFAPARRQTLLFSATYPPEIAKISKRVQRDTMRIDVTEDEEPARIFQQWYPVTSGNRKEQLLRALQTWGGALNLVFCNTKIDCAEVASYLRQHGVVAVALHGDLEQTERTQVLVRFANRSASVLIATDVAARGLDVKDLDAVFNYELPNQPDIYIHRIGRTARAGKEGIAVSQVTDSEMWRLRAIEERLPAETLKFAKIPNPTKPGSHLTPAMVTIEINGGRRNKLRPGDVLGALTAEGVVSGKAVGTIDLLDARCYVAVRAAQAKEALRQLRGRRIKGKQFRARIMKG